MSAARRWLFAVFAFLSALLAAGSSHAACNALAVCVCTTSATGVSFGSYSVSDVAPDDVTGSVTVTCLLTVARGGSFTVALSTGASNSFTERTLKSGSNRLAYNLYTTAMRDQVAGDGAGGSVTMTGAISALLTSITTINLYARAPAGQNVPSGAYSDTIVVTVTY